MAAPKDISPTARAERRKSIYERWIRGESQAEIAEALDLSPSVVNRDLKIARKQVAEDTEAMRAKIEARLEQLYLMAIRGWQASDSDRYPGGNPSMLGQARGALEDLRKMLGIDMASTSAGRQERSDGTPKVREVVVHLTTSESEASADGAVDLDDDE